MGTATFDKTGDIGQITLSNGPQNRLSAALIDDLRISIDTACDADVRVLLFRGAGENFSLGADITEWPAIADSDFPAFIKTVNRIFERIEELPFPTVAAVRGGCMGGGWELALHCDLVVAADDSTFRFPEATLAIPPLAGGIQRLAERAGRSVAARLVLLTEPITGAEAAQLGIVARSVPSAEVFDVATALANGLAQGPTLAYRATKKVLRAWADDGLAPADQLLLDASEAALRSEDFARAVPNAVNALNHNFARPVLRYIGK